MKAKLVIVGADIKPGEYKLKLPAVLGRGKEATLKLVHSLVSRAHCEIFETDGQLMVRDLGSLNGTYVAGQRIADVVPLPPGELLTVGSVTFRADYGEDVFLMPPPTDPAFRSNETAEVIRSTKETVATGEKEQLWVDPSESPADDGASGAAEDDFFGFLGDDEEGEAPADTAEDRTEMLNPQPPAEPRKPASEPGKQQPTTKKPPTDSKAGTTKPEPAKKNNPAKGPAKPNPAPAEEPSDDDNPFSPPEGNEHHGEKKSDDDDNWDSFLDGLQ